MPTSTDQLAKEYENIQAKFLHSPFVHIISTEGDPPNNYEIEFRAKGLNYDDAGKVINVRSHRVQIVVPFGYPHFPPNCKPLTPILHPDFDPDAICIGDFWNASRTLADLIIHIGKLITFQTYGVEDVFNPKALEWVEANSDRLPLDDVDFNYQEPHEDKKGKDAAIPAQKETATTSPSVLQPTRKRKSWKRVFIALGGVVLLALLGRGLFFLDLRNYEGALRHWKEARQLLDQDKIKQADVRMKKAQDMLASVRFSRSREKKALLGEINKAAGTEKFVQGMKGAVLIDGKYMTPKEREESKAAKDLIAKGKEYAAARKWDDASPQFQKALEKVKKLGPEIAPVSVAGLEELLNSAKIHELIGHGAQSLSEKKWDKAVKSYQQALSLMAKTSDASVRSLEDEVRASIGKAEFLSFCDQGDASFKAKKWNEAVKNYESALSIFSKAGSVKERVEEIKRYRDVAKFNHVYKAALQNYRAEQWDKAISNLSQSEILFERAGKAGGAQGVSLDAIRRKKLTAAINREENRESQFLAEELYEEAIRASQALVDIIDNSPYSKDMEFVSKRRLATDRIATNKFLKDLQAKIAFLNRNFEEIFKQKFPSSVNSQLSDPTIKFVKVKGDHLVFKMQCQEQNRRQRFTLEMDYHYDMKTGQWILP